ncbi:hypothetical protein [Legionella micdadei]|nr:hypothetical protein [Legionella micdadei]
MNTEGKIKLMREDLYEWISKLEPYIKRLNYQNYFAYLKTIIESGTSSERQKMIFSQNGSLRDVVKHNVSEFLLQVPLYRQESVFS